MDKLVRMVPLAEPFVEVALDEVEGIDRLEQMEGLALVKLFDMCSPKTFRKVTSVTGL